MSDHPYRAPTLTPPKGPDFRRANAFAVVLTLGHLWLLWRVLDQTTRAMWLPILGAHVPVFLAIVALWGLVRQVELGRVVRGPMLAGAVAVVCAEVLWSVDCAVTFFSRAVAGLLGAEVATMVLLLVLLVDRAARQDGAT